MRPVSSQNVASVPSADVGRGVDAGDGERLVLGAHAGVLELVGHVGEAGAGAVGLLLDVEVGEQLGAEPLEPVDPGGEAHALAVVAVVHHRDVLEVLGPDPGDHLTAAEVDVAQRVGQVVLRHRQAHLRALESGRGRSSSPVSR